MSSLESVIISAIHEYMSYLCAYIATLYCQIFKRSHFTLMCALVINSTKSE